MKYIIAGANHDKNLCIYKIDDDNMLKAWLESFPEGVFTYSINDIDNLINELHRNKKLFLHTQSDFAWWRISEVSSLKPVKI